MKQKKMIVSLLFTLPILIGVNCKKDNTDSGCYQGKIISLNASEVDSKFLESSWGLILIEETIPNGLSYHSVLAFNINSIKVDLIKEQLIKFKIIKLTSVRITNGLFPSDSYQYLAEIQLCNN